MMEKKRPCFYFQQGSCRYKDDGDCNGSHQFCQNGDNCTFKGCKFLHPDDIGFKETCKKSYFMCMHKDECKFRQHPNRNYVYTPNNNNKIIENDNDTNEEEIHYRCDNNKQQEEKEHDEIIRKYQKYNHKNEKEDIKKDGIDIKNENINNKIKDEILKIFTFQIEELKKYIDEKFKQLENELM